MSRRLYVTLDPRGVWGEVSGYGSRDLIVELRGRPPVYNSHTRAWCVQDSTARDIIAAAEARGFEVVVTEEAA